MNRTSILVLFALAAPLAAGDSTQWRGDGTGVAAEKGLPVTWSDTENVRWKAELPGRGLSSPIISRGRVFITACTGPDQERLHVLCLDEKTGKQFWERRFTATGTTLCHNKTNMAAPTPATDGERVYALFASHDLVCLDRDGNLVWFRSLTGDYPTVGNNVGMASSPVLSGDTVLVALENAGDSYALGIDKKTGENRWRQPRPRGINWVTPLVIAHGGKTEVVFQAGGDVSAYDVATGKKHWTYQAQGASSIPSPTFADGLLLVPGGPFVALRPETSGEAPPVVWQSKKLPTGYSSPVQYDKRVYAVSSRGVVNCADAATGKPLWDLRLEGDFAASPLAAGGKIYVVSEEGKAAVLRAGDKAEVLGTAELPDKILASPVAANGALYLRSDRHLWCIAAKK